MELLIVIVVLGILAGIVVFALSSVTAQAAVAACKSDASSVETAVTAYNAKTGGSPVATPALLTGNASYLRSWPNSPDYTISLDANGSVMVAAPSTVTPVAYSSGSACDNAGSATPAQQAASPQQQAAPHGATTTTAPGVSTTTAPAPTTTSTTHATTTTAPAPTTTTTTAPRSNGVTATPSTNNYSYYGGQDILDIHNGSAITAMTITIKVAQTTGVTYNSDFNSFPGDAGADSHSTGAGTITYTYVVKSGHSIPANYSGGSLGAQFGGTGSPRSTSGDTWSVVSTSGGVTSTISGTF